MDDLTVNVPGSQGPRQRLLIDSTDCLGVLQRALRAHKMEQVSTKQHAFSENRNAEFGPPAN